jgi:hypothetical protein
MQFLLTLVCVFVFCYWIIFFIFPNTCVISVWKFRSKRFQNEASVMCSYNDFYECIVFHERKNFAEQLINNQISSKHLYRGLSLIDFRLQYVAIFLTLTLYLHKGGSNPPLTYSEWNKCVFYNSHWCNYIYI